MYDTLLGLGHLWIESRSSQSFVKHFQINHKDDKNHCLLQSLSQPGLPIATWLMAIQNGWFGPRRRRSWRFKAGGRVHEKIYGFIFSYFFIILLCLCILMFYIFQFFLWHQCIDWLPKFATGLNMIIGCSSKSMWVMKLFFCQNDPLMGEPFWQNNSLVSHILFELQPIIIFSPVANFGNQSLFGILFTQFKTVFTHLEAAYHEALLHISASLLRWTCVELHNCCDSHKRPLFWNGHRTFWGSYCKANVEKLGLLKNLTNSRKIYK